jgi:hypothetical protein
VIFLGGSFAPNPQPDGSYLGEAVREITLPVGTALFIPILNSEASTLEGNGTTYEELAAYEQWATSHIVASSLEATIDGVPVKDLTSYRAGPSPMLRYGPLPANNLLRNGAPDPGPYVEGATSNSVADGYCLLLHPLAPGVHTIQFKGQQVFTQAADGFDFTFRLDIMLCSTLYGTQSTAVNGMAPGPTTHPSRPTRRTGGLEPPRTSRVDPIGGRSEWVQGSAASL